MSLWTLAFQVVNFVILAALLRRFLWKPVQIMIARRQEQIDAASKEADRAKLAADEDRQRCEKALTDVHSERETLLGDARASIAAEHARMLDEAHAEVDAIRKRAITEMEREREEIASGLAAEAMILAADIARRLLAPVASAKIAEAFLRELCEHLEHMPEEKLQSLREELGDRSAAVVATAPPLDAAARAQWSKRIADDLGARGNVTFIDDATLVAGAELRLPHTSISFSWRDGLAAARAQLVHRDDHR